MASNRSHKSSAAAQGTFWNHLFAPVDIASLVYFRIAFGVIMLWEVYRYFDHGWIHRYFIDPTFYFKYYGFEWIRPLPGHGMYLHFLVLAALAICIVLGLWYRISATLFFVGFTYVFLLDQANYLNHFYLISLISLLLIFVPAHPSLSIDSARRPKIHSNTAPAWTLWLLQAQIGIAYFYGGLAKVNDDWVHGEPMRMWLAARTSFPIIGPHFTEEWMVYLFSYGGLLLDLLIVPLLLWQRTRVFGFAAAVAFHLLNAKLFKIGIFPWFMIAATALFFSPDWPRLGGRWWTVKKREERQPTGTAFLSSGQRATVVLLGIYLALQLLVPLRHFQYPGNVGWTEEGHRFAWHMKLRTKKVKARFFATDPVNHTTWEVNPKNYLTRRQRKKMPKRPDMILQFCRYIASELRKEGYDQIEVRARVLASLNGRKHQLLIDPTVNLASKPRTLMSEPWIVPLIELLPNARIGPKERQKVWENHQFGMRASKTRLNPDEPRSIFGAIFRYSQKIQTFRITVG